MPLEGFQYITGNNWDTWFEQLIGIKNECSQQSLGELSLSTRMAEAVLKGHSEFPRWMCGVKPFHVTAPLANAQRDPCQQVIHVLNFLTIINAIQTLLQWSTPSGWIRLQYYVYSTTLGCIRFEFVWTCLCFVLQKPSMKWCRSKRCEPLFCVVPAQMDTRGFSPAGNASQVRLPDLLTWSCADSLYWRENRVTLINLPRIIFLCLYVFIHVLVYL